MKSKEEKLTIWYNRGVMQNFVCDHIYHSPTDLVVRFEDEPDEVHFPLCNIERWMVSKEK